MAVATAKRLITVEEFDQLPEERRVYLIKGELVPMPPMPGYEHGRITGRFQTYAGHHIIENELGEVFTAETFFLIERDPDSSIGPDWAFISRDRLPEEDIRGSSPVVPDVLLEVRSPSQSAREAREKMEQWLAVGVRVALEINPKMQQLTVYRPDREPYTLGIEDTLVIEDVLPGFALPIEKIFARTKKAAEKPQGEAGTHE